MTMTTGCGWPGDAASDRPDGPADVATGSGQRTQTDLASGEAALEADGWTVDATASAAQGGTLSLQVGTDVEAEPDLAAAGLVQLTAPATIRLSSGAPASGATVSVTLPTPQKVADGDAGAVYLAYRDGPDADWIAHPTEVSPDGRTLTAQTTHFSDWAAWRYSLASVFGQRGELPTCEGQTPPWVDEITYLDDVNAPAAYCTGSDPAAAEVLVVKVTNNRGYGQWLSTTVRPKWSYMPALNVFDVTSLLALSADAARQSGAPPGALFVPAGEQVHLGFDRDDLPASGPAVRMGPHQTSVMAGVLWDPVSGALGDKHAAVAMLVALVAIDACAVELSRAFGSLDGPGTLVGCLANNRELIYRKAVAEAVEIDPDIDPREAAKDKATILKLLGALNVGQIVLSVQELVEQGQSGEAVGDLTVFTRATSPAPASVRDVTGQGLVGFVMPSNNIGCQFADSNYGESVRCQIRNKTWQPPPQPDSCELDWGDGLTLGSEAEITCAGDTIWYDAEAGVTLAYGSALRYGALLCTSAQAGLRCENFETGRGFVLARGSYEVF